MALEPSVSGKGGLGLAELMAAIPLATDLGMGPPLEQALRTCLIAMRLARLADLPAEDFPAVYYGALLGFLGCTADAHETAGLTGDDIAFRRAMASVLGAPPSQMMRSVVPTLGAGGGSAARFGAVAEFMLRGVSVLREGVSALRGRRRTGREPAPAAGGPPVYAARLRALERSRLRTAFGATPSSHRRAW